MEAKENLSTSRKRLQKELASKTGSNRYLEMIDCDKTKMAITLVGKMIAQKVPFDLLDEAIMAIINEIITNLNLVSRETAKFVQADTVLNLVKELKIGKFNVSIFEKDSKIKVDNGALFPTIEDLKKIGMFNPIGI